MTGGGNKIAMSFDGGLTWKDITGHDGYEVNLGPIFADPDNPQRVCVYQWAPEPAILQAVDDEYSQWERKTVIEWRRTHAGWDALKDCYPTWFKEYVMRPTEDDETIAPADNTSPKP